MASVLGKRARTAGYSSQCHDASPSQGSDFVTDENAPASDSAVTSSKRYDTLSKANARPSAAKRARIALVESTSRHALNACDANARNLPRYAHQEQKRRTTGPAPAPYTPEERTHDDVQCPKTPKHSKSAPRKIPVTPRHQIESLSRRQHGLRTPCTPSKRCDVYSTARKLFTAGATCGKLIGRDVEQNAVRDFLRAAQKNNKGASMYVSGPPGTGKSSAVAEACANFSTTDGVQVLYLNCMSAGSAKEVLQRIAASVQSGAENDEMSILANLRSVLVPSDPSQDHHLYVITLDEIDCLLDLSPAILCSLFQWAMEPRSRLVIIGIANALDLTDRFLPQLKAKHVRPQLLPFLPYNAGQIADVIMTKLRCLLPEGHGYEKDYLPCIEPAAIRLCSKKVASQSGDVRKAFDMMARAIDTIEAETIAKANFRYSLPPSPISPCMNEYASIPKDWLMSEKTFEPFVDLHELTALTAPRATISHICRIATSVLSRGPSQRLKALTIQQKAVLCSLLAEQKACQQLEQKLDFKCGKTSLKSVVTCSKLRTMYLHLCKEGSAIAPLSSPEFGDVLASLETQGFVAIERHKHTHRTARSSPTKHTVSDMQQITNLVDAKEVLASLDGSVKTMLEIFWSELES